MQLFVKISSRAFLILLWCLTFVTVSHCQVDFPLPHSFTLLPQGINVFSFNVISTPSVLHFIAQCSLTSNFSAFTYNFSIVVSNNVDNNVSSVQTTLFAERTLFVREILVPSQILTPGLWNVTVSNLAATTLYCVTLSTLAAEIDVPYNVEWDLPITPPSWAFLRFNISAHRLLSMVAFQTQIDEDTWRLGMKMTRDGYPNLHTAIILPDTTGRGSLTLSELVTDPYPQDLSWNAAVFLISDGLPSVNRLTYRVFFSLNEPVAVSSNAPLTGTLLPLRSEFFNILVNESNRALFVTFTSSLGGVMPLMGYQDYPTYFDHIRNVFTEYTVNTSSGVTYYYEGVVPSSQALPGEWRLRLNNFFNTSLTYSVHVDVAQEMSLVVNAPPVSHSLDWRGSCVFVVRPPQNFRSLTLVVESPVDFDFLLQMGSYPHRFNYFTAYQLFVSTNAMDSVTKYIFIPRDFVRTLDAIYLRVLPLSPQLAPVIINVTAFDSEDRRLQDVSIVGGELSPFNANFFSVEVAANNTFYWYLRIDSTGGTLTANIRSNAVPFVDSEQSVIRREYEELFTPPLILYELFVPPNTLHEGIWFLELMAGENLIEYTLMSVLVEEYELIVDDPAIELELSAFRMLIIKWNVHATNVPLTIRVQPANVHVITRFNALPFTTLFEENVTQSIENDTLIVVVNQPQSGTLYARVEANTFGRFISVSAAQMFPPPPPPPPPPLNPPPVPVSLPTPISVPVAVPTAPTNVPMAPQTPQSPNTISGRSISNEGIALIIVCILGAIVITILLIVVILQRGVIMRMTQTKSGDYQLLESSK
jgi:hypothetical protein